MSNSQHYSATPLDPYQWRESVLSTRSLSYISQAGSLAGLGMSGLVSRQSSTAHLRGPPTRKSTLNSTSEYSEDEDIEMAGMGRQDDHMGGLQDIQELPDSVAHSLLFELPREIRDRIYALCLTAREGMPIEWPRARDSPIFYDMQPQLLRICSIVHDEAAPLLYTLNTLTFHHPSDANMFVNALAPSPMYGRHISNLSLHIKAQDVRMWMPYLTSTDDVRSLRADFPNLKELGVRFRSNNWQHQHSPEKNLEEWCKDSRLDEVMNGLRHVFLSGPDAVKTQISEREFADYIDRNVAAYPDGDHNVQFRKRLIELHKARSRYAGVRSEAPTIRVCCACRVHATHFNALTTTASRQTRPPTGNTDPPPSPAPPVREGEAFRGFTAVDLQTGVKRLQDPELGIANVARTVHANKNGILLALEIHCLDPRRDAAERAA